MSSPPPSRDLPSGASPEDYVLITDNLLRAADFVERLHQGANPPKRVIGSLEKLMELPDGARLLVHQVETHAHGRFGICEVARAMILRGSFERFLFEGDVSEMSSPLRLPEPERRATAQRARAGGEQSEPAVSENNPEAVK